MQRSNEQSLKEAIQAMIKSYGLKTKLDEAKIIGKWEELMGGMIAKHTTKMYIKDQKLFLKIDSAPLRHELTFAKDKMMQIINEEVGEDMIKEIVIR